MTFQLLAPQSRFGDKTTQIILYVGCPQNGTAVLKGDREGTHYRLLDIVEHPLVFSVGALAENP